MTGEVQDKIGNVENGREKDRYDRSALTAAQHLDAYKLTDRIQYTCSHAPRFPYLQVPPIHHLFEPLSRRVGSFSIIAGL